MLGRGKKGRELVEIVGISSLVPEKHLLRKIDAAVDFGRLYELVEPLYYEDKDGAAAFLEGLRGAGGRRPLYAGVPGVVQAAKGNH